MPQKNLNGIQQHQTQNGNLDVHSRFKKYGQGHMGSQNNNLPMPLQNHNGINN